MSKMHKVLEPTYLGRALYTGEDNPDEPVLMIPFFLFEGEFRKMSSNAKLMYALLLERAYHAIQNKTVDVDDEGRMFIFYTNEELQKKLRVSDKTVTKVQNELKMFELIATIQQGLGKPNRIYILVPPEGQME